MKTTKMIDTRSGGDYKSFCEAILSPSTASGGLYTFSALPTLHKNELVRLSKCSYKELCEEVFSLLGLDIPKGLLRDALQTYENFDDANTPVQLKRYDENLSVLELYHGPTRAFKDMALQPFGSLIKSLSTDKRYLILVATSGDTGPATLESFKDASNIDVVCLYPSKGTSDVQRLQMVTKDSPNLKVIGIQGNFDDAQSTLKALLGDDEFNATLQNLNISLSAANSVNIGRIVFQIVYHIWVYLELLRREEVSLENPAFSHINIIVPSGNFGNILGAFYAKVMGVPINRLICASNPNKILYEFLTTGVYDIMTKNLIQSLSPAMDIIKSSNVERVLFALFGAQRTAQCMQSLQKNGVYALDVKELQALQGYFSASFCTDEQCKGFIRESYAKGYVLDSHTACGLKAYKDFKQSMEGKFVLCSTAEWSKFAPTIAMALREDKEISKVSHKSNDLGKLKEINKYGDKEAIAFLQGLDSQVTLHSNISSLFDKPIAQSQELAIKEVKPHIIEWLTQRR